ncbi:MAG: hypothetical protein BI182_11845 [Acetobacterium sp. MES1]|uniref:beta strand repeat-containing protein n=1 Tax=Acetobacterium sp. MES1 TaxID=1899015 RepID=UPI000B9D4136|nr:hypothetical protein [Acetobacterium sp. MES1]OXS24854.1 MAG: hypothetical protein BI182_11845 [Acetobacterium sp. MES1]
MKKLKGKSLLTMFMVLALLLVSSASMVFADFNAFLVKTDDGKFYEYNQAELNTSYLAWQINPDAAGADMYKQFLAIGGNTRVVALGDSVKGWMDYAAAQNASLAAQIAGIPFVINDYLATPAAPVYAETVTDPIVVDPSGQTHDLAAYNAAVADANSKVEADYTAATWANLQTALANNVVTAANTQAEIDAATRAINAAIDALMPAVVGPSVTSATAVLNTTDAAVITGSAIGDAVKVSIDGAAEVAATLNADGTYAYVSPSLAVGTHAISVKAYMGTDVSAAATASVTVVAPAVVSVTSINGSTVQVVFNKSVDKTTAETTGNYTLTRLSTPGANAITKATLNLTDNKTVLLTTTTATVATTNGYALEVANVKDLATTANIMGTQEVVFSTLATSDTEKPALFGAEYEATTGKLTLTFNKNISLTDANFNETGITVKGSSDYTLVEGDFTGAATTTGNTVTLTLTAASKTAVNALGSTLALDVAAGSFKDATDTTRTNVAITGYPVTLTSAPGLVSAAYDENTSILTLTFDKDVKVGSDIDLTKISIKRDGVSTPLTTAQSAVQNTTANSVITIKLNGEFSHAGNTVLAKVTLAAGAVKNTSGTANALITDAALTYTNDTTKPTLVSAAYNSGTRLITLKFSEIVDVSTLVLDNVTITDGVHTDVPLTDVDTVVKTTVDGTDVVITLDEGNNGIGGDYADVEALTASSLKVYFAAATVKDLAANSIDAITKANAVSIAATDLVAPTFTVSNSAVSTIVNVNFSEKVQKADAENIANYSIKSGAVVLNVTKATLLSDGKTVELTTEQQAGITYTVKVSNVKDIAGNVNDSTATDTFLGVTAVVDTTKPSIASYVFEDVDASKSITKNDQIKLQFDESLNVDYTKVTYADFLINAGATSATTFGTGATFAAGATANEVVITLGTTPAIVFTDAVDVALVNDIKDLAGNIAQSSPVTIVNPGVAPKITNFDYTDTNGSGAVDENDLVVITYDRTIVAGTVVVGDFTFGAGITPGNATYAKTSVNQITMTLGDTSAIAWGATATINEKATANITDEWGVGQGAADGTTTLLKSADTTNPTISSVTFNDTDADKVMDAGETVVIVMSEAVHENATFAAGDFVLYNGATANPYEGKGGTATDGDDVEVSGNVITITIGALDGWATEANTTSTTFNFNAGTTSILDASDNKAAPSAGFGATISIL